MSAVWITIALLALGTVAIKAAGPIVLGGRELPPRVVGVITLLAPALLTALVVVETVGRETEGFTLDARLAGVAAAILAIAARLPIIAVVGLAAVAAALARALA